MPSEGAMKPSNHRAVPILLSVLLLLFLLHQFTQKVLHLSIPWADNYLDPLLCMPILLGGYQMEQRWLLGRQQLSFGEVMAITAFLSFVFEYLFPRFSAGFTADWWDVAAYFAGAWMFCLARKKLQDSGAGAATTDGGWR
ncbi:MAG: hypothetical protein H6557_25985 [Lewinellaceae bacterium]|nr:hypothetical protein [Phaeodactylibacter sp.]MCB9040087.1 hypothetical protein [Lewinellaceae bacterium]